MRGDRGGIDDLAAGALGDHLLGRGLDAVDDAEDVDVEDLPQVVGRHVQEGLDLGDARVGDHDVDAAELVGGPVDEREDGVAVGDVGRYRDRAATGVGDLLGDRLGSRLVHVADGDGVPVAGQPQRDPPADPPAGTGDDRGAHTRSFGVTRIFTFSSLLSINSRNPLPTRSSSPIRPVMNCVGVDLLVAEQADGGRVVLAVRERADEVDLGEHELVHREAGRVAPDRHVDDRAAGAHRADAHSRARRRRPRTRRPRPRPRRRSGRGSRRGRSPRSGRAPRPHPRRAPWPCGRRPARRRPPSPPPPPSAQPWSPARSDPTRRPLRCRPA